MGCFMMKSIKCHCVMGLISIYCRPMTIFENVIRQNSSQNKWFPAVYFRFVYVLDVLYMDFYENGECNIQPLKFNIEFYFVGQLLRYYSPGSKLWFIWLFWSQVSPLVLFKNLCKLNISPFVAACFINKSYSRIT